MRHGRRPPSPPPYPAPANPRTTLLQEQQRRPTKPGRDDHLTTIVLAESPWTLKFNTEDCCLPETTVRTLVRAFCTHVGARLIHRQIRSADDLGFYVESMHGVRLGARVLWISAHGEFQRGNKHVVELSMPDHAHPIHGHRITPADIKQHVARAGRTGLIVDSCLFGRNQPDWFLPPTVLYALTFTESVDFFCSALFLFKALEWIFDGGSPKSGHVAYRRFRAGVRTGRVKTDQLSLVELGRSLGARLYYRNGKGWETCGAPDFR